MKTTAKPNECAICHKERNLGTIDHANEYICMICVDNCIGYAVRAVYLAINELTEKEM